MYYYVIRKENPVSYWQGERDNRNNGFTFYASDAKRFLTFKEAEQEQNEHKLTECQIVIHFVEEA